LYVCSFSDCTPFGPVWSDGKTADKYLRIKEQSSVKHVYILNSFMAKRIFNVVIKIIFLGGWTSIKKVKKSQNKSKNID